MNKTLLRGIATLTVLVSLSAFAQKSTMVTTKVLDAATNAIMQSVSSGDTATLNSAKGYTDTATNGLMTAVEGKGYLTEHQSLSAYSTTEQMNTAIGNATNGFAKASDVTDVNGRIDTATNAVSTALLGEIASATNGISSESISDGQHMIDAAGNVYNIPTHTTGWTVRHNPTWVTSVDGFYWNGPYWANETWYITYRSNGEMYEEVVSADANFLGGSNTWSFYYTDENEESQAVEVTTTYSRHVKDIPELVGTIATDADLLDTAQKAVNYSHYLYDSEMGVSYEMKMRNDFFDLVCVTNVDLTKKQNWK